jgi:hypothetical protein
VLVELVQQLQFQVLQHHMLEEVEVLVIQELLLPQEELVEQVVVELEVLVQVVQVQEQQEQLILAVVVAEVLVLIRLHLVHQLVELAVQE